jgi:hypothetical protein
MDDGLINAFSFAFREFGLGFTVRRSWSFGCYVWEAKGSADVVDVVDVEVYSTCS